MKKKCDICGKKIVVDKFYLPYTEDKKKLVQYIYYDCCNYIRQNIFLSKRELDDLYSSGYIGFKRNKIKDLVNTYLTKLRISKYKHLIKNKYVLELGCGMGDFILGSIKIRPKYIEGVEMSGFACKFIKRRNPKIIVHNEDIENFKSDKKFDSIFMFHVIEHVKNPSKLIKNCSRMLSPGGSLIIETPNYDSWDRHIFGERWFNYSVPYHTYIFSTKSLKKMNAVNKLNVSEMSFSKFPNTFGVQFRGINRMLLPFVWVIYTMEYFVSFLFDSSAVMGMVSKKE